MPSILQFGRRSLFLTRLASLASLAPLAFLLAACGGAGDSSGGGNTEPPPPPPATVATISIAGTATVEAGKTVVLSAQAKTASGTAISGKTFAWSSSSDAVASVASDGTVSGKSVGAATITASVDGITGTLPVTVTAALPVVSSVAISGNDTLQAGATTKLSATVTDATGAAITSVPVTWSSSDATMMSVATDGTVSAIRIGSATITATAGAKSASRTVTSSLTPYTFDFPAGTSDTDAQMIRDLVQYGSKFFLTTFGRTVTTPTVVSGTTNNPACSRGGSAAATTAGSVIFCVANPGWMQPGPISKQKIVVHELFHVWQFQYKWLGGGPTATGPDWIIEGSAELVGYLGIDAKGLLPMETTRGCVVKEVTDFAKQQPPGLPALSAVESAQVFQQTVGPLYSLSLTAMDNLTTQAPNGILSLKTYTDAIAGGSTPTVAFQTAFNMSLANFYQQFPTYYGTLPIPAAYLCRV